MEWVIKTIDALSSYTWPIVIVTVIFLLRREIKSFITGLAKKNIKLKIGENEIEISEYLKQQTALIGELQKKTIIKQSESRIPEKNRILWVDDYPINNLALEESLRAQGFIIDNALSTDEAIHNFDTKKYDVVITDMGRIEKGVNNPRAGLILAEKIRSISSTIPILVFTPYANIRKFYDEIKGLNLKTTTDGTDIIEFVNNGEL